MNKFNKLKQDMDSYNQLANEVIDWSEIETPNDIDKWLSFCKRYLENYEWNNRAINDFLEWGKYGYNNSKLYFEVSYEEFYNEVEYCSDRMTLDRLVRCHTYYWNLKNKNKK